MVAEWNYTIASSNFAVTATDHNTFSFSADGAVGYYVKVSTGSAPSAPTAGATQSSYALNKWVTATNTGDITLSANQTYYVWAEDGTSGTVIGPVTIAVRSVTRTQGSGTTLTTKYDSSGGSSFTTSPVYVLDGSKVYVTGSLSAGYHDLVLKKGSSTISTGDQTITANTSFTSSATQYYYYNGNINAYYDNLEDAINSCNGATYLQDYNAYLVVIELLRDKTETSDVSVYNNFLNGNEVVVSLDLGGRTLNMGSNKIYTNASGTYSGSASLNLINGTITGSGAKIIENNTNLEINNNILNSSATETDYAIENKGNINILGGIISKGNSSETSYIIENNASSATLNVTGGTITGTIVENYGTVNMTSGTVNGSLIIGGQASSTATITGGTITATTANTPAVFLANGTLTLGDNSNSVNTNSPVIESNGTGIYGNNGTTINFYDGKVISHDGSGASVTGNPSVGATPTGYTISITTSGSTTTTTLDNHYTVILNKGSCATNGTTSVTATYNSTAISPSTITLAKTSYTISGFGLSAARQSDGATVSSTSTITSTVTTDGYYSTNGGSTKVLAGNTTAAWIASVSGYTDSSKKWIKAAGTTLYAKCGAHSDQTLPTITKTGYTCGWTTSSSGTSIMYASGGTLAPTGNTTLYGVCEPETYTISYNLNGGSASNPSSAAYNQVIELTDPVKAGYSFIGWSSSDSHGLSDDGTALSGSTSSNLTSWYGDRTTNRFFKNLTQVNNTVTLIAEWESYKAYNVDQNIYYTDIVTALSAAYEDDTIQVLTDITRTANLTISEPVYIDLNGHTINMASYYINVPSGTGLYIVNTSENAGSVSATGAYGLRSSGGYIYIYSGSVQGIYNNGTVTIDGGTVNSGTSYAIYNNSGKTSTMNSGTINGQVSNYGTFNMNDGSLYGKLQNTGTANIKSGLIQSTTDAIYTYSSGILTLGSTTDSGVDYDSPTIISTATSGDYYGIKKTAGTLNFYDGKVIANCGSGHSISGAISNINDVAANHAVQKVQGETTNQEIAKLSFTYNVVVRVNGTESSNHPMYLMAISTSDTSASTYLYKDTLTTGSRITATNLNAGETYYIWIHSSYESEIKYTGISFEASPNGTTYIDYYTLKIIYGTNVSGVALNGGTVSNNGEVTIRSGEYLTVDTTTTSNNYSVTSYQTKNLDTNVVTQGYGNLTTWQMPNNRTSLTMFASPNTNTYYNISKNLYDATLNDALSHADNNNYIYVTSSNSTVTESGSATLPSGVSGVTLDILGHTIDMGTNKIINNGELNIISTTGDSAMIQGNYVPSSSSSIDSGVIKNSGTLTIGEVSGYSTNVTIMNYAAKDKGNARVIVNDAGKTLTLNTGSTITFQVNATSTRYLIQNSGTINISGAELKNKIAQADDPNNTAPGTSNRGINNVNQTSTTVTINMASGKLETSGYGILNAKAGSGVIGVNMSGGEIIASVGIQNSSSGTVLISGGTITASSYGLYNSSSGVVEASGGKITATSYGIYNYSTGTAKATGADIVGTTGIQSTNANGKVEISGGTITATSSNGVSIAGGTLTEMSGGVIYGYTNGISITTGTAKITDGSVYGKQHGITKTGSSGTLTIGDSSTYVKPYPLIASTATTGSYYGVNSTSTTFNFYDGQIVSYKGSSSTINGTYGTQPTGYEVVNTSVSMFTDTPAQGISIIAPIARMRSEDPENEHQATSNFLNTNIQRGAIRSITFSNTYNSNGIDISAHSDHTVSLTATEWGGTGSGLYDITIGQTGGVNLPVDASYLFASCTLINDLDFRYVNSVNYVVNMAGAFYNMGKTHKNPTTELVLPIALNSVRNLGSAFGGANVALIQVYGNMPNLYSLYRAFAVIKAKIIDIHITTAIPYSNDRNLIVASEAFSYITFANTNQIDINLKYLNKNNYAVASYTNYDFANLYDMYFGSSFTPGAISTALQLLENNEPYNYSSKSLSYVGIDNTNAALINNTSSWDRLKNKYNWTTGW